MSGPTWLTNLVAGLRLATEQAKLDTRMVRYVPGIARVTEVIIIILEIAITVLQNTVAAGGLKKSVHLFVTQLSTLCQTPTPCFECW